MNGKFVLSLSLLVIPCFCMQIMRDKTDFSVIDETGSHQVQRCDTSRFLRSLKSEQLQKFEETGNRYKAIRLQNGDYMIREHGDIKGGGGLFGAIATVATLTVGGIATLGTFVAVSAVTLNPVAGGVAAAAVGHATVAAATYVAIVTTVAPTP